MQEDLTNNNMHSDRIDLEGQSNTKPSIELKNVSHSYTDKMDDLAVSDINLKLIPGNITSLLGHNGAGKSTIVNMVCGLLNPSKGTIVYSELNSVKKHVIGYCGSEVMSYPNFTLYEQLAFVAELKNAPRDSIKFLVEDYASKMGFEDKLNTKIQDLSGGGQRKMNLICALIGDPDILILDEPTKGVDICTR